MNRVLTVVRASHPHTERWVRVLEREKEWRVDPHLEVALATASLGRLSRDGCIQSFMQGLVAANYDVVVHERRYGKHWVEYTFRSYGVTHGAYFLFGLAWARGEWGKLRAQLAQTIMPEQRLMVLIQTGQHYSRHCWVHDLCLRVPIV